MKQHQLAAQPIEPAEFPAAPPAVEEVAQPEQWVQEEEKLRNERREVESAQERARRLVPGFDFKRFYL